MKPEKVAPAPSPTLPPTVVGLGVVSLLTDASSEAIFPLLPTFLAALGASNAFFGVLEGSAELAASALKYLSGAAADRARRLKPLVLAGYALSTAVRPLVALAGAPWQVLLVRLCDRVGKGVRTSPRDALIAAVVPLGSRARAFGFHRAMDHAGAALGTLLATGLLFTLGQGFGRAPQVHALRAVFLFAALPGLLALLALALTPEPARAPAPAPRAAATSFPPPLRRALVALVLFALANATDAFILLKAARLGAAPVYAPLLWLTMHLIKAAVATAGGRIADRRGNRNTLALGWLAYAVTWGALGFAGSLPTLFALTAAYGVSHGLVEGAERSLVAQLATGHARGRAFGLYNLGMGAAALLSSSVFGAVWDRWGSRAAFVGSAGFAVLAAAALLWLVPARPLAEPDPD